MAGYHREINKKFLSEFKTNLRNRILSLIRASDSNYLKAILDEITRLFKIMSGRMTSKRDIQKGDDFPDSKKYNTLLDNIDIDLHKIYNAESIIESDLQNVVNFNSLQREKQINYLTEVQKKVYSAYIKSKKGLLGITIVKENFKNGKLSEECSNVQVNLTKEALTLMSTGRKENRDVVDAKIVDCHFIEPINAALNIYPNNKSLSLGSFWKRNNKDIHFEWKDNKEFYSSLMVDLHKSSNISSCQFEAVYTYNKNGEMRKSVEEEISNYFQLHHTFIMVDKANSLHGAYSTLIDMDVLPKSINPNILLKPNLKLSIPFKQGSKLSTSIIIDFEPNDANVIPTVDLDKSFVQDINGKNEKFIPLDEEKLDKYSKTGRYEFPFRNPVIPARVEFSLSYANSSWATLKQYMIAGYIFEKTKTFLLETNDGDAITTTLTKVAWVFVDAQTPQKKEEERANKVMKLQGVEK